MKNQVMKFLIVLTLLFPASAQAADQWRAGTGANSPVGTTLINNVDTVLYQEVVAPLDRLLAGYRQGMNMQYSSSSTISVTAGEVMVSNVGETVRLMLRNTTSTNVTFANIDTGAEASATTYYVYAGTSTVTDGTATLYVSTSSSAPTGVTYYKRLGSFYNDASSNITLIDNDDQYSENGSPSSKSFETVYQATNDGTIVGYTTAITQTHGFTAYTDASNPPTTSIQNGYYPWVSGAAGLSLQISFPVTKGNYYKVTNSISNGGTLYFVPKQ